MANDNDPPPFALATPVVFFVFNRPELTRRVLAEIRTARPPQLFVIADGPRPNRPGERELCAQVRATIREGIDWPCKLRTDFAENNLGCGPRIFSGLQWAFAQVPEAIILEDDCLPHPTFFRFCEEMLTLYRDEPRVAMIAGTNFRGACPPDAAGYFFSRHCSIWGWATWRRALAGYALDLSWWRTRVQPAELRRECADWREHRLVCDWLDAQQSGAVNTWDVQWFAHVFRRSGFSIVPGTNLVTNLGLAGEHATGLMTNHLLTTGAARFPLTRPAKVERDSAYDRFLVNRHRPFGGWLLGRFAARVLRSPAGPRLRRGWHFLKRLRPRAKPPAPP